MSWPSFTLAYFLVALGALALVGGLRRERWSPMVRTVLGYTILLCVFDQAAESRRLWSFPSLTGRYILDVPLENILVTGATVLNCLLFFLLAEAWLETRSGKGTR